MKRSVLRWLAVVLLSGCAGPVDETKTAADKSPATDADVASQAPAAQTAATSGADAVSGPNVAGAASPIDAERLLATTLESAKAENKRVMVHLGAPW